MKESQSHRHHVLIVEDEQENIELLVRTLRTDLALTVARSVCDARAVLLAGPVDVVVADHRLPDGTGAELLREVARDYAEVGRVLVTAYGESEDVVAACNEGVVERFFLKPYLPQRLKSAVLELLRRRGGAARPRILLADDDAAVRGVLKAFLETRAMDVTEADDGVRALELFNQQRADVALVNVNMPRLDGVGLMQQLMRRDPDLPVLLLTSVDSPAGLSLLEAGAFDIISKPVRQEELLVRIEHAVWTRQQLAENRRLASEVEAVRQRSSIIADSGLMQDVLARARLLAQHEVSVLITGETGTGKELVARFIHKESRRLERPFIPVNCGAIPETLIESQLFGHEKGAFTDAKTSRPGFFESADTGTLFLDEIGELSPGAQVRFLRALELKEVTRIGSTTPRKVDVRVVVATHRNLEAMVREGKFREDLYFRLSGFSVRIPPLRERPADIAALIEFAAAAFCNRNGLDMPELTSAALKQARTYPWPGNVRELLHVVERTLITRGPARIDDLDLPDVVEAARGDRPEAPIELDGELPLKEALGAVVEQLEKRYLLHVLKRAGGHLGKAAQHAGIHRKSLYNKLKRYGISARVTIVDD